MHKDQVEDHLCYKISDISETELTKETQVKTAQY